jgi:hypothetical protein
VLGEDLMVIEVGEKIVVHRAGRAASMNRKGGGD